MRDKEPPGLAASKVDGHVPVHFYSPRRRWSGAYDYGDELYVTVHRLAVVPRLSTTMV